MHCARRCLGSVAQVVGPEIALSCDGDLDRPYVSGQSSRKSARTLQHEAAETSHAVAFLRATMWHLTLLQVWGCRGSTERALPDESFADKLEGFKLSTNVMTFQMRRRFWMKLCLHLETLLHWRWSSTFYLNLDTCLPNHTASHPVGL